MGWFWHGLWFVSRDAGGDFLNDQQLTDVVGGGLGRLLSDLVSQMIVSVF
jgi:hypothetical protein